MAQPQSLDSLAGISTDTQPQSLDDLAGVKSDTSTQPKSLDDLAGTTQPQSLDDLAKGNKPIGFLEQLTKTNPIEVADVTGLYKPAVLTDLFEATQRLQGNLESTYKPSTILNPLTGTPVSMGEGKQEYTDEAKKNDQKFVTDWLKNYQEEQKRGTTFGADVVKGVATLPSFMGQFAMSGGLATIGKEGAELAITKSLGKAVEGKLANAAVKTAGAMVGTAARSPAFIGATAEMANEYQQPTIQNDQQGNPVLVSQSGESMLKSLGKAALAEYEGNLAFATGNIMSKGVDTALVKLGLKATPKVAESLIATTKTMSGLDDSAFSKLLEKGGFYGLVENLGINRVADAMRYATGLQDNLLPTPEQLVVEASTLAVPEAVKLGGRFALRPKTEVKAETPVDTTIQEAQNPSQDASVSTETTKPTDNTPTENKPWQMTKDEFNKSVWFSGQPTDQKHSGWFSSNFNAAKMYANRLPKVAGELGDTYSGNVYYYFDKNMPPEAFFNPETYEQISPDEMRQIEGTSSYAYPNISVKSMIPKADGSIPANIKDPHKYIVEQALKDGKFVPSNVLAEYPDLANKYKPIEAKPIEPMTSDQILNVLKTYQPELDEESAKSAANILADDEAQGGKPAHQVLNDMLNNEGVDIIDQKLKAKELLNSDTPELQKQSDDIQSYLSKLNEDNQAKTEQAKTEVTTEQTPKVEEQQNLFDMTPTTDAQELQDLKNIQEKKNRFDIVQKVTKNNKDAYNEFNNSLADVVDNLPEGELNKEQLDTAKKQILDVTNSSYLHPILKAAFIDMVNKANPTTKEGVEEVVNYSKRMTDNVNLNHHNMNLSIAANNANNEFNRKSPEFKEFEKTTLKTLQSLYPEDIDNYNKSVDKITERVSKAKSILKFLGTTDLDLSSTKHIDIVAKKLKALYSSIKDDITEKYGQNYSDSVIPQHNIDIFDTSKKENADFLHSIDGIEHLTEHIKSLPKLIYDSALPRIKMGDKIMSMNEFNNDIKTTTDNLIVQNKADKAKNEIVADKRNNKAKGEGNGFRKFSNYLWGAYTKPRTYLVSELSGDNKKSVITRVLDTNFTEAESKRCKVIQDATERFRTKIFDNAHITVDQLAEISPEFRGIKNKATLYDLTLGENKTQVKLTMAHLIDIYLDAEQEKGQRHILEKGLTYEGVDTGKLTRKELNNIRKIVNDNPIAKKVADILSSTFNHEYDQKGNITDTSELKNNLNETSNRLNGYDIANEKKYWHLETKSERELKGNKPRINLLESMGLLKARTEGTRPLVIRDAFVKHFTVLESSADYIGYADAMRQAKLLLSDKGFEEGLRKKGYTDEYNALTKIITAKERANEHSAVDKFIGYITRPIAKAVLRLNVSLGLAHITGAYNFGTEINEGVIKDTLIQAGITIKNNIYRLTKAQYETNMEKMKRISPILWDRYSNAHIYTEGEFLQYKDVKRLVTGKERFINKGYDSIKTCDASSMALGLYIAEIEVSNPKARQGWRAEPYWSDYEDRKGIKVSDIFANKDKSDMAEQRYNEVLKDRIEYLAQRTRPTFDITSRSLTGSDPSSAKQFLYMFRTPWDKIQGQFMYAKLRQDYAIKNKTVSPVLGRARMIKDYSRVSVAAAAFAGILVGTKVLLMKKDESLEDIGIDMAGASLGAVAIVGKPLEQIIKGAIHNYQGLKNPIYNTQEPIPLTLIANTTKDIYDVTTAIGSTLNSNNDFDAVLEQKLKPALFQGVRDALFFAGLRTNDIEGVLRNFGVDTKQGLGAKGDFDLAELKSQETKPIQEKSTGSTESKNPYEQKMDKIMNKMNNPQKQYEDRMKKLEKHFNNFGG